MKINIVKRRYMGKGHVEETLITSIVDPCDKCWAAIVDIMIASTSGMYAYLEGSENTPGGVVYMYENAESKCIDFKVKHYLKNS